MSSQADKDPDENFAEAALGLDPTLKLINRVRSSSNNRDTWW